MEALVDASLLVREPGTSHPVRFRLLDTLRLFALGRLAAQGIEDDVRAAHARFHLHLIDWLRPHLHGPGQEDAIRPSRRRGTEHPRGPRLGRRARSRAGCAPRRRSLGPTGTCAGGSGSASPTSPGYSIGTPATLTDSDRAWALTVMADLAANPGEVRLARGPRRPSPLPGAGRPAGLCAALLARAYVHRDEGTLDLADSLLTEAQAIAEQLDDEPLLGRAAMTAWAIAERRGSDQAERLARQELARFRSLGSRRQSVTAMRHLAVTLRAQGDLDEATRLCESVLADWEELGERQAVARGRRRSPTSPASGGTGTARRSSTGAR